MAEYSVKQLAEMFNCSKQAIFNEMDEMSKLGYTRKEGIQYFVNEGGFNYLLEKKGRKTAPVSEQKAESFQVPSQLEDMFKQQISSLQSQLDEMKKEKEYFKGLAESKDKQIASLMDDYKSLSTKAMTIFLPKGKEETEVPGNELGTNTELATNNEQATGTKQEVVQEVKQETKSKKGLRGLFSKR